jgi:uncharacterized protein (DUF2141 family)
MAGDMHAPSAFAEEHVMKQLAFATVAAAFVSVAFAPSRATATAGQTLTVNVSTFRNTKGVLGCRLYAGPTGFPMQATFKAQQAVPIHGATARCTFAGLEPGTYAVVVLHDENQNQKADRNFLGFPTEGYGVSNNKTHATSMPRWDESKFQMPAGRDVAIPIVLRY